MLLEVCNIIAHIMLFVETILMHLPIHMYGSKNKELKAIENGLSPHY